MNGLLELKLGSYSLIESKSKKQLILRLPTTNARRCALLAWWGDSGYHNLDIIAARCGYDLKNHHHALADAETCAAIALEF